MMKSVLGQDKRIKVGDMSSTFQVCFPGNPDSLKTTRESNLGVRVYKGSVEG